jgi:tetratricopeptide (TPR) repeat protein
VSGDFVRLAKLYQESLPDIADSEAARALAWRLTEIHEQKLADLPRAVELLRGLADTAGPDMRVLGRLEDLLRRLDQHRDREDVLAKLAEIAPDPQAQAEYLASLGDLRLAKLDDARGAVEAFRAALERVPTHPGALAALRGLLPRAEVLVDVLTVLEPLAEGRGDFIELATLYEARVAVEEDGLERAGWLRRVAEIYETRLRDAARAVDALGRAVAEDPMSTATIDDIERVARAAGLTADAAQKLEAVAAGVDDSAFTELALRAARLHEESAVRSGAGDPAAERLYQRILEKDAENAAALEALEALHRRRGDIPGLISVLTRRGAQEMDPERRRTFYGEVARLHEKAGDLRAAITAWQAVRDAEEGNAQALGELGRLLEREGETAELVKVFEERARFAEENSDRAAFYFKVGELRAGALGDVEGAAQAFRDVLDVEPAHAAALNALARVEEERGDFAALEEVLQRRLSAATPGERPEVLLRLARNASEKLKDADRALGYLHEVLEILPGNEDAFGRVERLLIENERWHELVEAYERRADVVAGDDLNAERAFRLKAAEVWAVRLGNTDAAAETVQKILSRDPTHVGALLVLAGLMEHEERWAEATEALDKAAASAETGADRAETQFRKGRALAAQGADEDAVQACYLAALDANTGHVEAIQALEALSRKAQNLGQLVQLLEMREHLLKDDGERRQLLIEISALYRGPLGTPAAALDAQSRLSQMSPGDLQIQEDHARVLLAAGQGAQAEKILTALVDQHTRAKRPKAVAGLQQLLGGLAESRGDGKAAAERYQAAYQLDPAHAGTLAALGRLALADKDIEKARKVYRSLLLQSFDEKAAGITKAQVYLTLGKLHVQANEVPKARNMFERGLETEPKNAELKAALAALPK